MMKILLVSDTHNRTAVLEALLEKHAHEVRLVCHMGDHAWDLLKFQQKYPSIIMVAVAGNCDYSPDLQSEILLNVSACLDDPNAPSVKIMMTHGHLHAVKRTLSNLVYNAKEKEIDAVFFGHTHMPFCEKIENVLIMNPGSPNLPRGGTKASYGIVEITPEGAIEGKLITL